MKNTNSNPILAANANIGKVCQLMSEDEYYGDFLLRDIRRTVVPPVSLGQCLFLRSGNETVGFMTYATVNSTVEREVILADRRIQPEDWSSGDRLWIIDAIIKVPKIWQLRRLLCSPFDKFDEVKYLRRNSKQEIKAVLRYRRKGEKFVAAPFTGI
ncbi:MAG: toxin-activating lysine-acyltransferase [Pseudomonadota bacterium]